ncbi:Enoyl-CoA hydratase/isomerase [Reticulomyxa filosa]|uniref:Enoyl-CoA hydratase/isomerase n=1 Tax=Reticulomyxa filosa TaxID=46433 RepID=X6NJD3_RETFI|nr:Enoyl-CoA hydratase/isomerase [Reticulomyxa filosa]|eukprot:ETO25452.1 Enoyl-CoA hydratase/isomerase [Reticulomyxa filosa]
MAAKMSQLRLRKLLSHLEDVRTTELTNNATSGAKKLVTTKVLPSGIGIMTLNNPPVNSLPPPMLEAIDEAVTQLTKDAKVKAVIVTGQNQFFSGGADIKVLQELSKSKSNEGIAFVTKANEVLNRIESSEKPFIAAINGYALGGGCELAMV